MRRICSLEARSGWRHFVCGFASHTVHSFLCWIWSRLTTSTRYSTNGKSATGLPHLSQSRNFRLVFWLRTDIRWPRINSGGSDSTKSTGLCCQNQLRNWETARKLTALLDIQDVGSTDASQILIDKVAYSLRQAHLGFQVSATTPNR